MGVQAAKDSAVSRPSGLEGLGDARYLSAAIHIKTAPPGDDRIGRMVKPTPIAAAASKLTTIIERVAKSLN